MYNIYSGLTNNVNDGIEEQKQKLEQLGNLSEEQGKEAINVDDIGPSNINLAAIRNGENADVYTEIGDKDVNVEQNKVLYETVCHKYENANAYNRYEIFNDLQCLTYCRRDLLQHLSGDEDQMFQEASEYLKESIMKR